MEFNTRIAGIPCICHVTYYTPEIPAYTSGLHEDSYPAEGGDFEFEILDRNGRKAEWLERKLTDEDEERLYQEFLSESEYI